MTTKRKLEIALKALTDVYMIVEDHPLCDHDLLDNWDINRLCEIGGDVADWTNIAHITRQALEEIP